MIVALLDSGVDPSHVAFGGPGVRGLQSASGLEPEQLRALMHRAASGELSSADIATFSRAAANADPTARGALLPGRSFAGHLPDDEADWAGSNTFDYNGHGTAAAGILVRGGHTVLPLKVSYDLVPELSLGGIVAAFEWLLDERERGLDCDVALMTFGAEGVPGDLFDQIVPQLVSAGLHLVASGQTVGYDIAAGGLQHPSDLPGVLGVDEVLPLIRARVIVDEIGGPTAYDTFLQRPHDDPNLFPSELTEVRLTAITAARLADEPVGALSEADCLFITDATRPFVSSRLARPIAVPLLINKPGAPPPSWTEAIATINTLELTERRPRRQSSNGASNARTGTLAPAAHTGDGYVRAFGSSAAAPLHVSALSRLSDLSNPKTG